MRGIALLLSCICHQLISHLFQIKFCGYEATKLYKPVSNRCGALCRSRLTIRPEDGSVAPKTCSRENKLGFMHIYICTVMVIDCMRKKPTVAYFSTLFLHLYGMSEKMMDTLAIVSVLFSVTYGLEC